MEKKLFERQKETIQKSLQQLLQERLNYLARVKERRTLFLEQKKQKATEHLLIQTLSNERTLLLKGMLKIDRLNKNEAVLRKKKLAVQERLQAEKYKTVLLKHMKEIRAQKIHERHCEEKFVLEMMAFYKASERLEDAKAKVATVKKKNLAS
nr:leucine-rich repeat and IQ domain-containing protein 3-like [Cavia porcellus]